MNKKGLTLFEALISVFAVIITVGFYLTLAMGNFWWTEASVLKQLKVENPSITEVLKTKRKVWGYSVFTVKEGDKIKEYCLDTNMLWNYNLFECKK